MGGGQSGAKEEIKRWSMREGERERVCLKMEAFQKCDLLCSCCLCLSQIHSASLKESSIASMIRFSIPYDLKIDLS